jgi:hypothetical protein
MKNKSIKEELANKKKAVSELQDTISDLAVKNKSRERCLE